VAARFGIPHMECSAKDFIGVLEPFNAIGTEILKGYEIQVRVYRGD